MLGLAKSGRENSENAISYDLDTANFWIFSTWPPTLVAPYMKKMEVMQPFSNKCSAIYDGVPRAKIIHYSLGCGQGSGKIIV
jgi:hypothetical protein